MKAYFKDSLSVTLPALAIAGGVSLSAFAQDSEPSPTLRAPTFEAQCSSQPLVGRKRATAMGNVLGAMMAAKAKDSHCASDFYAAALSVVPMDVPLIKTAIPAFLSANTPMNDERALSYAARLQEEGALRKDYSLYAFLANLSERQGLDEQADRFTKQIEISSPQYILAHYKMVERMWARGQEDEAIDVARHILDDALPLGHCSAQDCQFYTFQVSSTLAYFFGNKKSYEKAIEHYGQALDALEKGGLPPFIEKQKEAQKAKILNSMGASYRDLGQFDKALDVLEQALDIPEILPKTRVMSLISVARIQQAQEHYEAAIETYSEVIDLQSSGGGGQSLKILYNMALSHKALGDYDEALDILDKFRNVEDHYFNILSLKGDVLWLSGDKEQGKEYWNRAYVLSIRSSADPEISERIFDKMKNGLPVSQDVSPFVALPVP